MSNEMGSIRHFIEAAERMATPWGEGTTVVRIAPIRAGEPWVEGKNYLRVPVEEFHELWLYDAQRGGFVKMEESPAPPARDWAKEQTGCELYEYPVEDMPLGVQGLPDDAVPVLVKDMSQTLDRLRVETREAFAWDGAARRWVKVRIERA